MSERPGGPVLSWRVRGRTFRLDRPLVAGVLNITPDSFSDGGHHLAPADAIARARRMAEEGADLLDVGAESSRPGAAPVDAEEEWGRLAPVLAGLGDLGIPISVDTTKAEVAERALDAGAAAINDVSGLRAAPRIAELAARAGAGLVVMHMRGTPRTMQEDTAYEDLTGEVRERLADARRLALEAGCGPEQVAVDPGIGFGKSPQGSVELIARLGELAALGAPIWIGPSRKSFLGALIGAGPGERLAGTIAACLAARRAGAHVFRVHDVRPVREALAVDEAIRAAAGTAPGAPAPAEVSG